MTTVFADITMTLDGFIAGPDDSPVAPLGVGGGRIHTWAYELAAWRERLGRKGGTANPDAEIMEETFARAGASIMGRRMFHPASGPLTDEASRGQWGDDPPFHGPVFVITHHTHEPVEMQGGTTYTFVTNGIAATLEGAKAAAGDKDVQVSGGASVIQQYINAGLLDEIQVHVSPVLLGSGRRLFEGIDPQGPRFEPVRVIESPSVTHIRYRISS